MQQGDSYYPNYPNPNPTTDLHQQQPQALTYASAPPFSTTTGYHPQQPSSADYYPPNPHPYNNQFDNTPYQSQPAYDNHHQSYNNNPPILLNHNSSFQYPSPPPPVYDNYTRTLSSDIGGYGNQSDPVYPYQGAKVEPYGSRGTAPKSSSTWKQQVVFDDFGRPIGLPGNDSSSSSVVSSPKIVKAVPKAADTRQDLKAGVQKFRVKLLAETTAQTTMDVLCQIGLDGIRMLDPSTSRTLRIYSLDTIARCEVYDSSTFAFWSKSSVDIEPRRIRLQSNSYTTNTLLDTVTAATFQVKEMGGRSRAVDAVKVSEQSTEKKKGLGDWMNIIKPPNEEKDHWVPDEAVTKCTGCGSDFSAFNRKHHCRNCGDIFCDKCTHGRIALTSEENAAQVRVCDRCMLEVTHRLSSAKEAAASRSSGLQSHEDLAKKLQEELERNHKSSSGSKFEGSSRRMKEVACPTCTVHLQVQVPSSGAETIECGVCQHPFLVSAR